MPPAVTLTSERFLRHGLYLLDAFDVMYMWIGRAVSPALVRDLFDRPSIEDLQTGKFTLPTLDTPIS